MTLTTPKRLLFALTGVLAAALLLFLAYAWITLHFTYSEGERAGFLQ
ncbi:MAG: hypothetical protein H7Z39_16230, partial [Burkholderiaceae bacterium]|nr:hypothetical protein [Burkholderiaceae bacterium]